MFGTGETDLLVIIAVFVSAIIVLFVSAIIVLRFDAIIGSQKFHHQNIIEICNLP